MNSKQLLFMLTLVSCFQITPMFFCRALFRSPLLNKNLLEAVKNHNQQEVATLLAQGANPNSFKGFDGILSKSLYGIDRALRAGTSKKDADQAVQILKDLLNAGLDTNIDSEGYDCLKHVKLLWHKDRDFVGYCDNRRRAIVAISAEVENLLKK